MGGRARFGRILVAVTALGLGATVVTACELPGHPKFVVTTNADGPDVDPGDGVCEMTVGAEDCSLRAAIDEANRTSAVATVDVPNDTYRLTRVGVDDDNRTGDLDIDPRSGSIVIAQDGTDGFAIDASMVEGGIDVVSGSLAAFGVGVSGASGDGVRVRSGATGAFTFASFHGNGAAGVRIDDGARGQLWVTTVSENSAGGVANQGVADLRFATVTANSGGGLTGAGAVSPTRRVSLESSLITHQASGDDCAEAVWFAYYATASDMSCTPVILGGQHNNVLRVPVLAPLSGGFVPFHPIDYPDPTGAVRDSIPLGEASCIPGGPIMFDQRGEPRPAGGACDRGAWEGPALLALVVDTATDAPDDSPGDGRCRTASGACSLRGAVDEANAWAGPDTITIAPGIDPVLDRPGRDDDANVGGDLDITDALTIVGGGSTIDVSGAGDRAFDHRPGAGPLLVRDLHLIGADVRGGTRDGGALWSSGKLDLASVTIDGGAGDQVGALEHEGSDTVVLTDVTVRGAVGSLAAVRALRVDIDALVVEGTVGGRGLVTTGGEIDRSTFASNDAGGVRTAEFPPYAATPTLTVRTSTIESNRAPVAGAGARVDYGTRIVFERSTVSGNDAPDGAGVWAASGASAVFDHTTVADNPGATTLGGPGLVNLSRSALQATSGAVCATTAFTTGYNVASDASCGLSGTDDLVVADLELGPLADNGGSTRTHLPAPTSAVLDRIPRDGRPEPSSLERCVARLTDQRGVPLPQGFACDSGSVESEATSAPRIEVTVAGDGRDDVPGDGLCRSNEAGGCSLRAAIDEANQTPGADAVEIAPGVDPVLSIPGRDEDANATGDLDITAPLILRGGGATVSGAGLDRVLDAGSVDGLVLVDRLTITDGDAGDGPGSGPGGMRGAGGLRLDRVAFRANRGGDAGALAAEVADDGDGVVAELERVELVAVTVTGSTGGAAVVVTHGALTIDDSDIDGNDGGGVGFDGSWLTVRRSTVRNNVASSGAGIRAEARLGSNVLESWIVGNTASGDGGGVQLTGASIERSTISGNTAGGFGGGVRLVGGLGVLRGSTVSGNRATDGSAVFDTAPQLQIEGSTIAGNRGGASLHAVNALVGGTIIEVGSGTACATPTEPYLGFNLFADDSCGSGPTDRIGQDLNLGPLQDNGGPTPTHRPGAGSAAIDSLPLTATVDTILGPWSVCGFLGLDQRNLRRPQGPACDIGSIEQ